MKSICFFSSYFNQEEIPYYVNFYLENLRPFFTELVFITNEKKLNEQSTSFLDTNKIQLLYVSNEGWDFGMWYKAFKIYDVNTYDRIGLVNDSCILFKSPQPFFEWLNKELYDYCGMVDSNAFQYHIQSYFIIINKRAIKEVYQYFMKHGILADVKQVIHTYEVGLSAHLQQKGYSLGACYTTKEYKGEYSPTFLIPKELIERGFPLIKKKIIFSSFRKDEYLTLIRMKFRLHPKAYIQFIKAHTSANELIDFNKIGIRYDLRFYIRLLGYRIIFFIYQILRKFKQKK